MGVMLGLSPGLESTAAAGPAHRDVDHTSTAAEVERAVVPYVSRNPDGVVVFDRQAAESEGASSFVLEVGDKINVYSLEVAEFRDGRAVRGMPGYGNWCGPGNSGPGAPTNTLDRLCMNHDKCYAARGYFSCSCDRELVAAIDREYGRMGRVEKGMANAIKIYFKTAPCK